MSSVPKYPCESVLKGVMRPWENITLKIAYINVIAQVEDIGDGVTPKGLQASLFTNITASMGLPWERISYPYTEWGRCLPNKTCTGQLAPVVEGVADLALGPVFQTSEVIEMMTTWLPSQYMYIDLVQGLPDPYRTPGPFSFFRILPLILWLLLGLCVLLLPTLAWTLGLFQVRAEKERITFIDHASIFYELLLQEAPSTHYSSDTLRVLFAAWMLASLVMSTYLSATLKSVMSVRAQASRIDSVQDVLDQDPERYRLLVPSSVGTYEILEAADFPLFRELAAFVRRTEGLTRTEDLLQTSVLRNLEQGRLGVVVPCYFTTAFFYYPPSKVDDAEGYLYCSKDPLMVYYTGWATSKDADEIHNIIFKEMERRLQWMFETPVPHLKHYEIANPKVLTRILERTGAPRSHRGSPPLPNALTFREITGALVLLGICSLFAIGAFITEMAIGKLKRRQSLRNGN